ncbi:hypothetical protein PanWU01x14_057390 [Parasponia andersonii]|uniref:Uncharacterized protein n=1 Tax=Parasponia andersonii TaxID=3476 RepID=A0A2P5DJT4_PARAD|nr:hypothetical protein PanWU01x14_057390 [Parasponia andersonii]
MTRVHKSEVRDSIPKPKPKKSINTINLIEPNTSHILKIQNIEEEEEEDIDIAIATANQIAIASIEIQALDSHHFIERKIDRPVNSGTGAITNLFKKLVIAGLRRESLRINTASPTHTDRKTPRKTRRRWTRILAPSSVFRLILYQVVDRHERKRALARDEREEKKPADVSECCSGIGMLTRGRISQCKEWDPMSFNLF